MWVNISACRKYPGRMRSLHGRMDNRLSRGISTYPLALTPRRAQIPESQRGRYTKYHLKTGWIRRSICTDPWLSLQSDNRSARCSQGGSRSSITHPIIRNPYVLVSPVKRASTNNYHLRTQRVLCPSSISTCVYLHEKCKNPMRNH